MPFALKTLRSSSDFRRVSRDGKRWVTKAFIIQICPQTQPQQSRVGLTVSRKVGKAVVRNKVKRRMREMMRAFLPVHPCGVGYDIVLVARHNAETYRLVELQRDLRWAVKRLELA